jgi:recombination protein RecA
LSQLAVVRVSDLHAAYRATVELTRSGGFGLVVLDLGPPMFQKAFQKVARPARSRRFSKNSSVPFVTKLVGLAQKTSTAVVVLTEKTKESSSLSSLVSLRLEASRVADKPNAPHPGFRVELEVLKDKRRGPGRRYREACRAPAGLR